MARAVIRTAVVVETLPRGRWLAWPFADPDLAQLGSPEDDPRLIMALALPEHLKTLRGAERARFATPPGTFLRLTEVALTRPDLPPRLARQMPPLTIAVPWVATPYGKELWLHVPPLKLTMRADDASELDALVVSEVRRVVAATEPSPDALLSLFPSLGYRLEWIDIALESDAATRATAKSIAAQEAHALLLSVASPVHASPRVLEGPPLVRRAQELELLDRLLAGPGQPTSGRPAGYSVLVHGPELVGKTALIEGWVRARLATPEPRDPRALPPLLVYATSGARLMAGMSLLGQWQERLRRVLQALATLSGVLWIEHLGELIGEAGHGEELAGALRPWLEDGRVRLVSELRDDEIDRLERRHPALMATLRRVRLKPLDAPATLDVLDARRTHGLAHEPERPTFEPTALPELVALAGRYQSHLALPGSAVRLGEDLRTLADADRAHGRASRLDSNALQRHYAALTGLPAWLLDDRRPFDVDAARKTLAAQVIGQDAAVRAVADSLAVIKTRLAARGKPLVSFLFAGPTGVGKTELARALAVLLFGSEARLARFDMSEFMDAAAAERLIRGSDGQRDGLLTRRLRKEPLSVVLLDEIEKAHQSVFDLLLQALGEGRLTDARGRTASLEGAIVILTSNLGASDKVRRIGLVDSDADSLAAHYLAAVRRHFSPELVNRLERIIPFAPLGAEPLRHIVRLQLERVRRRRGLLGIELGVSDEALDFIAAAGTTAEYGARALRRAVERLLVTPLAHAIAKEPARTVARVEVSRGAEGLAFATVERPKASATDPLARVGRLRREARSFLTSASVREVHDRVELIDADLLRGAPPGPLLAERAHLAALLRPFHEVNDDLEQLEDLLHMGPAPTAAPAAPAANDAKGPEIEGELAWAEARIADLGVAAFEVLTAIEPHRDHALLGLTELDDGRAFQRWLLPLIEAAEVRRWTLSAWIAGEHGERWPYDLELGPPRSAEELYSRIAERPSNFRHLVLGVVGRHAGTLLACEAGLVAFRPTGGAPAHLLVKLLSTYRAALTPDTIRDSELLAAPPSESHTSLSHGPAARVFLTGPERVTLAAAGTSTERPGDVAAYFAAWERHAAWHLRAFDDNLARDRSELFESPFDEELLVRRLMREMDAEREAGA